VLLQRACGEAELTSLVFKPEDLDLLLQIARERDPNGIRRSANVPSKRWAVSGS